MANEIIVATAKVAFALMEAEVVVDVDVGGGASGGIASNIPVQE